MNEEDLRLFKKLLLEMRRHLAQNVSQLQEDVLHEGKDKSTELSDMPLEHLADRGSDNFQESLLISVLQGSEAEICDIDAALQKIEEGTYGTCENCDAEIPKRRLKVLPFARLCVGCKQEQEQEQGSRSAQ